MGSRAIAIFVLLRYYFKWDFVYTKGECHEFSMWRMYA